QPNRDRFAAIRFFPKLLRATGRQPRVIITDKLRSYGAAKRVVMPGVAHRQHRYLNKPRGELASTDAREGETNATDQICSARPAVHRGSRHRRLAFPPPTPPALRR